VDTNPQGKAFKSGGKNRQLAVSKYHSYVENDGQIGVFTNDGRIGELEYIATINKLFWKSKVFKPRRVSAS
jgi:hypothetical protein